jgi:hypothetical protein
MSNLGIDQIPLIGTEQFDVDFLRECRHEWCLRNKCSMAGIS